MKKGFVQTENYKRLADAHRAVLKRGAREAGIVIVEGMYGIGKSELLARWAADNRAIFIRCKQTWTIRALLDEVAECMGLDARGRNQQVQARIIGKLAVNMVPLMFDEADFLIRSTPAMLEVVRDITDTTGTACFLVSMGSLAMKIARYGHIAGRVNRVVELPNLTLADVKATIAAKASLGDGHDAPSLPMDDAAIHEIAQQCQGQMRLLLNALANIEDWAQVNGWKRITGEHLKGKELCVEFNGKKLGRQRPGLA